MRNVGAMTLKALRAEETDLVQVKNSSLGAFHDARGRLVAVRAEIAARTSQHPVGLDDDAELSQDGVHTFSAPTPHLVDMHGARGHRRLIAIDMDRVFSFRAYPVAAHRH